MQKLEHLFSTLNSLPAEGSRDSKTATHTCSYSHPSQGELECPPHSWKEVQPEGDSVSPYDTQPYSLSKWETRFKSDPWESLSGTAHIYTCGSAHQQTARLHVALRGEDGAASRKLHRHLPMASCSTPTPSPGTRVRLDTKEPSFILAAKLLSKEKTFQDNRFLWGEHKRVDRWFPIEKRHQ